MLNSVPSHTLPEELTSINSWTTHKDKRPAIPPDQAHNGQPYSAVSSHPDFGFLFSKDNDIACIDVDFPGSRDDMTKAELREEKESMMQLAVECGYNRSDWHTPYYLEWVKNNTRVFKQLEGTELEPLLESTFCEWSPSGLGIHIWVRVSDKDKTNKAYSGSHLDQFHGQFSLQNAFMTTTGIPLSISSEIRSLATVSIDFAPRCFKFPEIDQTPENKKSALSVESDPLDAFMVQAANGDITEAQINEALNLVPCLDDGKVNKHWEALTGKVYEHYYFWLTIGMALHDYGSKTNTLTSMFISYLNWSKKDTANFKSEEDVEAKWRSFDAAEKSGVTIATLMAMAARMKFEYPRPMFTREGKRTVMPQINEYVNFAYLMQYYNIKLWEDDLYYLSGDEEIMKKYFRGKDAPILGKYYGPFTQNDLDARTLVLCQDSNWRKLESTARLVKTWISHSLRPLDIFLEWLNTPFDDLPEPYRVVFAGNEKISADVFDKNSTVEYLFDCLNAQYVNEKEKKLYFTLFKKLLMQVIKFREPDVLKMPFVDNGGILILSGRENTYKSTFCKLLVPRMLDRVRKEVNTQLSGEKNLRDFLRYFSNKTIIQVDEFESVMDISSSFFKNLISGNDNSFVDIYGTQEKNRQRRAVIIGTTNKEKLVLSEDGTRRLWFIPVGKIDTDSALRVNLHKLYNDLRQEFKEEFKKGIMPWLLSQDEIDYLNEQNMAFAAMSDLDLILEELWPITNKRMPRNYLDDVDVSRDRGPKTMTSGDVRAIIELNGHKITKLTRLEHALRRHCTKWTGLRQGQTREDRNRLIKDGKIHQTWHEERQKYLRSRWIMPPRDGGI